MTFGAGQGHAAHGDHQRGGDQLPQLRDGQAGGGVLVGEHEIAAAGQGEGEAVQNGDEVKRGVGRTAWCT